jgi:hypothetical protein
MIVMRIAITPSLNASRRALLMAPEYRRRPVPRGVCSGRIRREET